MTQLQMFQCKHPEGQLICPCGKTSVMGEKSALGYQGWGSPTDCHHFEFEGQTLVALCPLCDRPGNLFKRMTMWVIQPREDEPICRWLNRLYAEGFGK